MVNRYCASGLETIGIATGKIQTGMADMIIAGGTESMSLVPTIGWKTVPNYNVAKEHPDYYFSMGLTAEAVAQKFNVSREDQDEFSYHSHMKALAAIESGRFKAEIVPIAVEEVFVENDRRKTKTFLAGSSMGWQFCQGAGCYAIHCSKTVNRVRSQFRMGQPY